MILHCNCQNDFQDNRYGVGRRVFNPMPKQRLGDKIKYRCTVCLAEKWADIDD